VVWQEGTGTRIPGRRRSRAVAEDAERGRRLFDILRHRVYAAWPVNEETIEGMALEEAVGLGSPISERERRGMARRIYRWMVRHYNGRQSATARRINRGRDRLEWAPRDLKEKQAIAGSRTSSDRRTRTAERIVAAINELQASEQVTTLVAIAARAGVSKCTIGRYASRQNPIQRTKPWEAEGISRRTWYRRKVRRSGTETLRRCPSVIEL
jgi:hypothetical protein